MSNGRKTFSVGEMLFRANSFMKNSKPEQTGERKGTQSLMESVLHASGNYIGFGFLDHTTETVNGEIRHNLGDESRICFYVASAVREDYSAAEESSKGI